MRPILLLCAIAVLGSAPGTSAYGSGPAPEPRAGPALERPRTPFVDPREAFLDGPAYLADRIEIRLRPQAAREARAALRGGSEGDAPRASTGVADLDGMLAAFGPFVVTPEFRGEVPPEDPAATDFTAFLIVRWPSGTPAQEALVVLRGHPDVASADPIAVLPVSRLANDSLFATSTWLYQPPTRRDIQGPEAWDVTTGDTAIVVAILDTGVLPYHPDIGGVAGGASQIWTNRREALGAPGVDDDGNGYVDDLHGWDFVDLTPGSDLRAGEDGFDEDNDPNDMAGHGTAVAGLVGALSNNTIGMTGVAWNVRLMPLRIGWSTDGNPRGLVDMSFVARAIRYATRTGAHVLNCSFATLEQAGLGAAAREAVRAGLTIVSAAGNGGQPHDLADRDDVIAVAALNSSDGVAPFSNVGDFVDVSAPGGNITSTYVVQTGADSIGRRTPTYLNDLNGTSFASPLVAGGVALFMAQRRAQGERPPHGMEVLMRLRETAADIRAANPGGSGYGAGRLDALQLLVTRPTSTAAQTGSETSGPAVALGPLVGGRRVAYVTIGGELLVMDGQTSDTLARVPLGGVPIGALAGARLGDGRAGLFVALSSFTVAGFDSAGAPLTGWPVTTMGSLLPGGVAIGDLEGDGAIEIVGGDVAGRLWAWRESGTRVTGFPLAVSTGFYVPVALADLDGDSGQEIVAAGFDGDVHAVRFDGAEAAGWPVGVDPEPAAPVVARSGRPPRPLVAIPVGTYVYGYERDGSLRFATDLSATPSAPAAVADVEGDRGDEVLLTMANRILVVDSSGVVVARRGFPLTLPGTTSLPLVVGALTAGRGPGLMVRVGERLVGWDLDGAPLAAFPKPGRAGRSPSLIDIDRDGATEVLAGTGTDSVLYVYDAGAGTASSGGWVWPTPRGAWSRAGSRDALPPPPLTDVRLTGRFDDRVSLAWTAVADAAGAGLVAGYLVRFSTGPLTEETFDLAPEGAFVPAGTLPPHEEEAIVAGLAPATRYDLAVSPVDAAGNRGPISNVVSIRTGIGGPLAGVQGAAIAVAPQPATGPVRLYWQTAAGWGPATIRIVDLQGRTIARLDDAQTQGEPSGITQWDGRDTQGRVVPAGLYFALLTSGRFRVETRIVRLP